MSILKANHPPPINYYADIVIGVFDYVLHHHQELLNPEETAALHRIIGLSTPSIRLLARLLTRRGPWFRIDLLHYDEVGDTEKAVRELQVNKLCAINDNIPADLLLNLLRKEQLSSLFPLGNSGHKTLKKAELTLNLVSRYTDQQIRERVSRDFRWLNLKITPLVMMCKLLYFGNRHHDWSAFILEDLGVTQCESYQLQPGGSVFGNRAELDQYLLTKQLARLLPDIGGVSRVLLPLQNKCSNRWLERARNKALNTLGRNQERLGNYQGALQFYKSSHTTPARERQVRIHHKLSAADCVQETLAEMRRSPWDVQERLFAERFPGKHPPAAVPVTQFSLATGDTPEDIEIFALNQLKGPHGLGWHTENSLQMGLFGLAFWDVVFADVKGAFLHPFQSRPLDLYWSDFFSQRQTLIEQRLRELNENLPKVILETHDNKYNLTNSLVNWRVFDKNFVDHLVRSIPAHHLLALIKLVLEDIRQSRSGFPDLLMIYGPNRFEFVEVKGPTDQLQPNQRVWLQRLADANLPARVFKIQHAR